MITEIYENLFQPASPEEVEDRAPKAKFKVGDRVRKIGVSPQPALEIESVAWSEYLLQFYYWFKAHGSHIRFSYYEKDLELAA